MKIKCAKQQYNIFDAVILYVLLIGGITLLSLITGPFTEWISGDGEIGVAVMRGINNVVTVLLMLRVLSQKNIPLIYQIAPAFIAGFLSLQGYEIIGVLLVALAAMLPRREDTTLPQ